MFSTHRYTLAFLLNLMVCHYLEKKTFTVNVYSQVYKSIVWHRSACSGICWINLKLTFASISSISRITCTDTRYSALPILTWWRTYSCGKYICYYSD